MLLISEFITDGIVAGVALQNVVDDTGVAYAQNSVEIAYLGIKSVVFGQFKDGCGMGA